MESKPPWYRDHRLWLEGFALVNLAFLSLDIWMAHSVNSFRHPVEKVPFWFSLVAPPILVVGLAGWLFWSAARLWRVLGHVVGTTAVVVGVAGLVLHLSSRFFREQTLASLVYTAPFAAPLSYTGIGLLLIMNRMVDGDSPEWPLWVLLLALGGFAGNFIFSVADHAQNGFFYRTEWIPVAASALAVGFLLVPFLVRVDRSFVVPCAVVLVLQAAVGLVGAYYHSAANLHGPSPSMWNNFIFGAPALAPLLFPNLALLAFIGLWVWRRHLPAVACSSDAGARAAPGAR
jgi:hypothetical protein